MKRRLTAVMVCLGLGILSGCSGTHDSTSSKAQTTSNQSGTHDLSSNKAQAPSDADTYDAISREAQATLNEIADTLATIKDKASAQAAKPKLKTLEDRLEGLKARQAKLPKLSDAENKKLEEKHKLKAAGERISHEISRIATLDGGRDILKDVGELGGEGQK